MIKFDIKKKKNNNKNIYKISRLLRFPNVVGKAVSLFSYKSLMINKVNIKYYNFNIEDFFI